MNQKNSFSQVPSLVKTPDVTVEAPRPVSAKRSAPQRASPVATAKRGRPDCRPIWSAETVKRVANDRVAATVDRSDLATAQTPQGFRRSILRAAWERLDPDGVYRQVSGPFKRYERRLELHPVGDGRTQVDEHTDFALDIQATLAAFAWDETRLAGPDFPDPIAMATPSTRRRPPPSTCTSTSPSVPTRCGGR